MNQKHLKKSFKYEPKTKSHPVENIDFSEDQLKEQKYISIRSSFKERRQRRQSANMIDIDESVTDGSRAKTPPIDVKMSDIDNNQPNETLPFADALGTREPQKELDNYLMNTNLLSPTTLRQNNNSSNTKNSEHKTLNSAAMQNILFNEKLRQENEQHAKEHEHHEKHDHGPPKKCDGHLKHKKDLIIINEKNAKKVNISNLSDNHMMQKIISEKIQQKIKDLMNMSKQKKIQMQDSGPEISSGRLEILLDRYNDTRKLYEMRKSMPLDQKICLTNGVKMRYQEIIFGMTPEDYQIYRDLGKINNYGEQQVFYEDSVESDSGVHEGHYHLSSDEKAEFWIKRIQQKCIVNHQSNWYQAEQIILSFCCLVSSYFYMYLACFGPNEDAKYQRIFNSILEGVFSCDLILTFFVDLKPQNDSDKPIRNLHQISKNYLNGSFTREIIPLIPLQLIKMPLNLQNLFYLIKTIRLLKCINILDIPKIMKKVKVKFSKDIEKMEKSYPDLANDPTQDNNKMIQIILISLMLKTLKLIMMISNFCYFIGMGWLIMCRVVQCLKYGTDYERQDVVHDLYEEDYFIIRFNMNQNTNIQQAIIAVYFAFTSFTTVGFGDFYPVSDLERVVGAIMLVFGVAIFSFIMGKFIQMLNQMKDFNRGLDDGDSLSKFFGVIEKFNKNNPINIDLKHRIESHFKYKWEYDKNQAFCLKSDLDIFYQIPEMIQDHIFYKFLFSEFLQDFKKYFVFEKKFSGIKHNYYSWEDQAYRNFMFSTLRALEPKREEQKVILYNELDDFPEITFFNKGQVDIGFEINRKKYFVLRKGGGVVIADYGCTFNHKSQFIYKTHTICEGFIIRRQNWHDILNEYDEISQQMKKRILSNFFFGIKIKVLQKKNQELKRLKNRSDINEILCVSEKLEDAEYKEGARKFLEQNMDGGNTSEKSENDETQNDVVADQTYLYTKITQLEEYETKMKQDKKELFAKISEENELNQELKAQNESLMARNQQLKAELEKLSQCAKCQDSEYEEEVEQSGNIDEKEPQIDAQIQDKQLQIGTHLEDKQPLEFYNEQSEDSQDLDRDPEAIQINN